MADKERLAGLLAEIAVLMELKGENPFKIRAYANAAHILTSLQEDIGSLVAKGELRKIKGIGKGLAAQIEEWARTGKMGEYEELKASLPAELPLLLKIPGLGPKKVRTLYDQLGVRTLGELEYACRENRLTNLKGFGGKTQDRILEGIRQVRQYEGKFLSMEALAVGAGLLEHLRAAPGVVRADLAGSLRRFKEVVKDIDLVAAGGDPRAITDHFLSYEGRLETVSSGPAKTTVIVSPGIAADLRVVPPESFPFALLHATGSKEHNAQLRGIARGMSLKLNEYGLFRDEDDVSVPCPDEAGIYAALGLSYIPAELREGLGEIDAAASGTLPELVRGEDIRGIVHVHTSYSDGLLSMRELAEAVRTLGYDYLGITDHSKTAFYAGGLRPDDLERQRDEVEQVREEFPDLDIYWGIESDILPDGSLDYPDSILERFDFIIGSIHSHFTQEPEAIMNRLIRVLENPYLTILGHLTGRLLLGREGYPVDHERILETAARNGKVLELNANPHRLDLDWRWCRVARDLGVKIGVNPDAHSTAGLQDVYYGVMAARKGWLRREDVWNAAGRDEMRRIMETKPWRRAGK